MSRLPLRWTNKEQLEIVILQSRSPNCGLKARYDGLFYGKKIGESGITAQLLMEHGLNVMDVEEL